MKTRLNLVTLALLSVSTQAFAFDFGVEAANTTAVKTDKWACKQCKASEQVSGQLKVGLGGAQQDNDHAANATGYTDGFAGSVDADYVYRGDGGQRTEVLAHELGSRRGKASISTGVAGQWQVDLGYRSSYLVDSVTGESGVAVVDNQLTDRGELQRVELDRSRNQFLLGGRYMGERVGAHIELNHETREGAERSSISSGGFGPAQNLAKPIDQNTTRVNAGIHTGGQRWAAEVGYLGSWFDNRLDGIQWQDSWLQQDAVSNQAQSVFAAGRYHWSRTHLNGRVSLGQMEQDGQASSWQAAAGRYEAKVDTADANFRLTSRLTSRTRLSASVDYSDRDNQTTLFQDIQLNVNPLSGQVDAYQPLDIERTLYKLSADYRWAPGLRLSSGVEFLRVERTEQYTETTKDTELWAQLRYGALDKWDFRLKGTLSDRDGSDFQSSALTSTESNDLMRKYHLADRRGSEVVFEISHMPIEAIGLDINLNYAFDDYDDTHVGLVESERYGFESNLDWRIDEALRFALYGGYDWVMNRQLGTPSFGYATWAADTDEEFGFVGGRLDYDGLAALGINLSLDYSFSYSESEVGTSIQDQLGDYYAYTHSVVLSGDYQLTARSSVGLKYQYERHFDTDYADIPVLNYPGDGVANLTTLGLLGNNYNSHLVMATFSWLL
ncbi:MtrB/PioB family decaheme-associated outer membrane protein [Ferrimonas balearica]|uniref:MtrB/PioB family decaheme-associated outer membrane protein n=1 Tax=Ferrimonas balearica TaxID=44012 RepID=UPI001C58F98A|nr:MtrB/PioB family decaheme-associated outer membrane protein [Ferrimonas balearica]MBW3141496.1 MtrB/PioB family decaheme-associated outer membrane protein [Ferrimonas balearica]